MSQSREESLIAVIECACNGDRLAFATLCSIYESGLYRYLVGFVGRDDAHDLLQETFLKALNGLPGLHDPASFPAWLYTIARHLVYDFLRRKKWQRQHLQSLEANSISHRRLDRNIDDFAEIDEQRDLTRRTLEQLPPRYRECLLLQILEDFSYAEISLIVGLTPGSVGMYLSKARKLFREIYQDLEQQVATEREV